MPDTVAVAAGADEFDVCRQPDKTTITKHAKRRHSLEENHLYVKEETPGAKFGTIEGYASQFDLVDFQHEVVRKGAFTKTITEQDGKIVLSAKHFANGGDIENAVATIVELKEDDYGLWFKANWYGDEASQAIRKKVVDLRKNGVKVFSSIGYMLMKWGFIKSEDGGMSILEIQEVALKEVTLTLNPANEGAVILEAKNKPDDNSAGSSGADDDPSKDEPKVTSGTAEGTVKPENAEGSKPDSTPAAAPTVANEVDTHSADAEVIEAQAKTTLVKAKAALAKAKLAELSD